MRIYLAADVQALRSLREGGSVTLPGFAPSTDDEQDEFDALSQAAADGVVVIAVEADHDDRPVTLDDVQAFHVDVDGTGDLAWYATQEIDEVIDLL